MKAGSLTWRSGGASLASKIIILKHFTTLSIASAQPLFANSVSLVLHKLARLVRFIDGPWPITTIMNNPSDQRTIAFIPVATVNEVNVSERSEAHCPW